LVPFLDLVEPFLGGICGTYQTRGNATGGLAKANIWLLTWNRITPAHQLC
jgi:hypothetical protein